ncbi:MAG TPA: diacylglycerol kinase family protein [Ktedonobacteraceae bacterium]|jgi:diacylglycerol kinase
MSQPPLPPGRQPPPVTEWGKFIAGFAYAFQGLGYAFRTQRNIRVHATIAVVAIILGLVLHISALEFAMVFIAITSVFSAEMFNTVIELSIDLSTPEYHPLAKIAKDVAAGAVLLSAFLAIIIGLFIFGPHLWTLISRLF